ncbi:MAG: metallophosphoesterase [Clostridia bacterium]|nr:metallophosphoesterase [Clostridia bacterium]
MKIGVFSDLHFCSSEYLGLGRYPQSGFERLTLALNDFKHAEIDFCVCLGDMVDKSEGDTKDEVLGYLSKCMEQIRAFEIPFYLVPGNHDFLMLTRDDFKSAGVNIAPFVIRGEGVTLIAIDANYRENGHFDTVGEKWDDAHIPDDQLEMLEREIEESSVPCVVLIHENLDPTVDPSHQVRCASRARRIIQEHASKVRLVLQGHYHYGADTLAEGVPYHTVKSICVFDKDFYEIIEL